MTSTGRRVSRKPLNANQTRVSPSAKSRNKTSTGQTPRWNRQLPLQSICFSNRKMSRSDDPGHFFQSDASDATRARRAAKSSNKHGNPIVLQSKILGAIQDPFSAECIYIAESAGCVRKVNVRVGTFTWLTSGRRLLIIRQSRESKTVYRGPAAPVTTVAIGGQAGSKVFAGCWDKTIWSWDRETLKLVRQFRGHSDFVKVIICATLGAKDVCSVSCILSQDLTIL